MARNGPSSSSGGGNFFRPDIDDYWRLSSRPLHTLVLITPLVVLYEIGSFLYLTDTAKHETTTIRAKNILEVFFANFGVAAVFASAAALAMVGGVLLIMHIMSKQSWRIRWTVVLGMVLEAGLWALPLVVFGAIFKRAAAMISTAVQQGPATILPLMQGGAAGGAGAGADHALREMPTMAKATIALGAGIYEELLFRLIGIALLHFVAKDILQAKESVARAIAVVGTAVAFAAYHPVSLAGGGTRRVQRANSRFTAS